MNIYKSTKQNMINESEEQLANRLYESYQRSSSKKDFIAENGASIENDMIYAFIGLNESVKNESKRFVFENGMYIPGINPKVTGRLSLYNIAESSKNADEFVKTVSEELCENWLGFTPTQLDKRCLKEAYNAYSNTKRLN